MLTIYHSNRLDVLKDLLIALIKRTPLINPLQDEQILVQSPGMAQWLRLQLAEGLGIAAAVNFPLPASFLWKMYTQVLPDVPERSAFSKEAMTWKIIPLMQDMLHRKTFTPLRNYLTDDTDDLKSYQLAGNIADIFDQYLVYRPEWIMRWEAGDNIADITAEQQWQPELWRALVAQTHELKQSPWHRANMHRQFNGNLSKDHYKEELPERLFIFGISALPPHFIESLQSLGKKTQIHLMITNPCRYFWGSLKDPKYVAKMATRRFILQQQHVERLTPFLKNDWEDEECSNSLLASMGKLGRDYLYQIHDIEAIDIDAFANVDRTSLLKHIQADILDLIGHDPKAAKQSITLHDKSLALHSCHSPLREIEVLHDQLLHLFSQHPEITPKDIIIMLPDVDIYSPWIQAVFGSLSQQDARYIPFSISDLSAKAEHPILACILKLLHLDNSRCTAPELLELLEIPALQRRFKLNSDDLATLRTWVHEAGIRWSINHRQQDLFDLPIMPVNTWLFGLRRIFLGYAMPESTGLYDGILPLESVQGIDAAISGQLADFIEQIESLVTTLNKARSIHEWMDYINTLLEQFFQPEESDEYELKLVRDAMTALHEQLSDAKHTAALSKAILASYLNDRITNTRNSQRFLAGKLNFCTLMPMRSIPFKVIGLLGMNDGAYPRSIAPTGFDLIAQNSQRGDRSRREDDRYLFLEALLSAQQYLYISYVGKNIQDGTERVPSVVVTELLNYCEQRFTLSKENNKTLEQHLTTVHPLQAFSPELFKPSNKSLFSYAKEWLPSANRQGTPPPDFMNKVIRPPEIANHIELELTEYLRFFKNTCQYFCNQRLKIFFNTTSDILEETEPFVLDGLNRYNLAQSVLENLLTGEPISHIIALQRAKGSLPYGALGELFMTEQIKNIASTAADIKGLLTHSKPASDIEIDLTLSGVRLYGWLRKNRSSGLIRYRASSIKSKDIISSWIEHLCYCAMGHQGITTQFGLDDKNASTQSIHFKPLAQDKAVDNLSKLITLYLEGLEKPLAFFPETALTWLKKHTDEEKAYKYAKIAFEGNTYFPNSFAEGNNPYISRIYPDFDASYQTMTQLSRLILGPAIDSIISNENK